MAGVGKSTIGEILAEKLGWAFMDSDKIIEALYAEPLQSITDKLGKAEFLKLEETIICGLDIRRCVIATGGSVVYSSKAIDHLHKLGAIVYLHAPWEIIKERIAQNPERGIVSDPGQSLEQLYAERQKLYTAAADMSCKAWQTTPEECSGTLIQQLKSAYNSLL